MLMLIQNSVAGTVIGAILRWMTLRANTAALVLLLTPTLCAQSCPHWTRVNLLPRADMAMAFDTRRGVTVMFGGNQDGFEPRDTREWDGTEWTLRAQSGPPQSSWARMVFDDSRGVCVLLTTNNQTWEWNGATWTLRSTVGPTPQRRDFALAYDAAHQRTVLFGGTTTQNSQLLQDTWMWDGQSWTLAATSGPSRRSSHAMAYDPMRQCVVLFGGLTALGTIADTWEWRGQSWTLEDLAGPEPRFGHAMAFSHPRGRVVFVGGVAQPQGVLGDAWEWNGKAWSLLDSVAIPARSGHGFVEDVARQVLVSFGGYDGLGPLGDTRELSFDQGLRVELKDYTGVPSRRHDPAIAFDKARNVAVLFGGMINSAPEFSNQTWEWNGTTWVFRDVKGPSARRHTTMAYDERRNVVVLFGGYDNTGLRQDTWEWDGTRWIARARTGPPVDYSPRLVYDAAREVCLLYTGLSSGVGPDLSETWAWDGMHWELLSIAGPPPRFASAIAYDPIREVVVMHGGFINNITFRDTWEWDGRDWMWRVPDSLFRYGHQMVYDPTGSLSVVYGGRTFEAPYMGDLWRWNPTTSTWLHSDVTGPNARYSHGMAFDSTRNVSVMYGGITLGTSFGYRLDTWTLDLHAPPSIVAAPTDLLAGSGGSATFSATASGPGPYSYQWRRNGVALSDGGNIIGAHAPMLSINPVSFADAGAYDVQISNACGSIVSRSATLTVVQSGDATGDGHVDIDDLLAVITAWGPCPPSPARCPGDVAPLGGDGTVNVDDLLAVIVNWGA